MPIIPGSITPIRDISLVCQDLIAVERREGLRSVCSLFMLTVADSGARKTRAEEPFTEALRTYDREMRANYEDEIEAYEVWLKKRKTEERALVSAYSSLKRKVEMQGARSASDKASLIVARGPESLTPTDGKTTNSKKKEEQDFSALLGETEKKLDELRLLLQSREKPRLKRLLYSHSAISDLERSLYENWPSAALLSNEGADIVLRRTEADMAKLDRLWDGQAIDVIGKRRQENVFVGDPRLTMSLMIQPSVFDRFLQRKGERARGIGFMPRFLVARPSVAYGERTIDHASQRSTKLLGEFNERVRELLAFSQKDFRERSRKRVVLRFTREAQRRWEQDYNDKERGTADDGIYSEERDFISRYSEHVARLAALFQFFEEMDTSKADWHLESGEVDEREHEIRVDTLDRAIAICEWYVIQYRQAFNPTEVIRQDAKDLLAVLKKRLVSKSPTAPDLYGHVLPVIELRRYAPYRMRDDRPRFDRAMDLLIDTQQVRTYSKRMSEAESLTEVVELLPPKLMEKPGWLRPDSELNG